MNKHAPAPASETSYYLFPDGLITVTEVKGGKPAVKLLKKGASKERELKVREVVQYRGSGREIYFSEAEEYQCLANDTKARASYLVPKEVSYNGVGVKPAGAVTLQLKNKNEVVDALPIEEVAEIGVLPIPRERIEEDKGNAPQNGEKEIAEKEGEIHNNPLKIPEVEKSKASTPLGGSFQAQRNLPHVSAAAVRYVTEKDRASSQAQHNLQAGFWSKIAPSDEQLNKAVDVIIDFMVMFLKVLSEQMMLMSLCFGVCAGSNFQQESASARPKCR